MKKKKMKLDSTQQKVIDVKRNKAPKSIFFTDYYPDEKKEKTKEMLHDVCYHFQELTNTTFKVGFTERRGGQYLPQKSKGKNYEYIRLNPEKATKYTVAHEMTHIIQYANEDFPYGERACEIRALARVGKYYYDGKSTYLDIPKKMRSNPATYRDIVQMKAKEAIKRRNNDGLRTYMAWFEKELEKEIGY